MVKTYQLTWDLYPKLEDYPSTDYFCIHTLGAPINVSINQLYTHESEVPGLAYSFDKINWVNYTFETVVNVENHIYFKATKSNWFTLTKNYHLNTSGECAISGKISTLFNEDISATLEWPYSTIIDFPWFTHDTGDKTYIDERTGIFNEYSYYSEPHGFFQKNTNIKYVNYLILNINDISYCTHIFLKMFDGCTSLYNTPALPWTSLSDNCYMEMFMNCPNLKILPNLPATNLKHGCYIGMFGWCPGIEEPPVLPATTLAEACYASMFQMYKQSYVGNPPAMLLKYLPKLPATTLAEMCYMGMFGFRIKPGNYEFRLPYNGVITDPTVLEHNSDYTGVMFAYYTTNGTSIIYNDGLLGTVTFNQTYRIALPTAE